MARRIRQLNLAAILSLLAVSFIFASQSRSAFAAATPPPATPASTPAIPAHPTPTAQPSATAKPTPSKQSPKPDEWTEARRVFEQLSPDQQKKFLDNLDQWKSMPAEERELFRDRELFRREKIAQEIQAAIGKSSLRLNDDEREVYALRYTQERRKIEESLHKEMDQKRQSMVGEMLARLKVEFSTNPMPGSKAAAAH